MPLGPYTNRQTFDLPRAAWFGPRINGKYARWMAGPENQEYATALLELQRLFYLDRSPSARWSISDYLYAETNGSPSLRSYVRRLDTIGRYPS